MIKNAVEIKEKILNFLKVKGPALPVEISKNAEIETLFAGAFLSELSSERALKISNMKVGGSPLYYLAGQEEMLHKFHNYLNNKEKDAFLMLKHKQILKDEKLEPSIRVALRSLKDFAFPITAKEDNKQIMFWRIHTLPEKEAIEIIKKEQTKKPELKIEITNQTQENKIGTDIIEDIRKEQVEITTPESRFELLHPELAAKSKPETIKPVIVKKPRALKDDFLKEVQNVLAKKNISIAKTEYFDKKQVIIRAVDKQEILVFAFNKKKISDKELVKCYKKALAVKLHYVILIKDNLSKKMQETIDASKSLLRIEKLSV